MRPNDNIRNNEPFSHTRYIDVGRIFDISFARNGSRVVQLLIQGQVLNVSERIDTVTIDAESHSILRRDHTLFVSGLDPNQEGITPSHVVAALREYDEASHRQSFLNAIFNDRVRCLRHQAPRRFS